MGRFSVWKTSAPARSTVPFLPLECDVPITPLELLGERYAERLAQLAGNGGRISRQRSCDRERRRLLPEAGGELKRGLAPLMRASRLERESRRLERAALAVDRAEVT
jgi:hypothetical protein